MEETFVLILLVLVMLIGSYLAGSIPLVINFSEVNKFSTESLNLYLNMMYFRKN